MLHWLAQLRGLPPGQDATPSFWTAPGRFAIGMITAHFPAQSTDN